MNEIWNHRYATEDYVYGINPNEFLKNELQKLKPSKILFPAEGEGRNAVFAAINKWDVVAFDSSVEGKKKAEKLAATNQVSINYLISSMEDVAFEENSFDVIALISAHNSNRADNHKKLIRFLKPGGTLILEGFSKKQISNNSGGPKSLDMLFSVDEMNSDFSSLSEWKVYEAETELKEGVLHRGKASVIRVIGKK